MLAGALIKFIGIVGGSTGWYLVMSSGGWGSYGHTFLVVCGFAQNLGNLLVAIGLVGICIRFGVLGRRNRDLEALSLELQERFQE